MKNLTKLPDGVQGIIMVGENSHDLFQQKFLLVQDYNDRGRGDGILMCGLPGGGVNENEHHSSAINREVCLEEVGIQLDFVYFGCYKKIRPNGFNYNHLYIGQIYDLPSILKTNDPLEVSDIKIKTLSQIIEMAEQKLIHEGSIRLKLKFLNGIRNGSLNQSVRWNGYTF